MRDQARVVVIGGGITGCWVLYHLARSGWKDVVLVEKSELTSGATCMAMGLLTQFNASPTMMRFRKYSAEMYDELNVYEKVGSLRVAASKIQHQTLLRDVSRAKGVGLDVSIIGPGEALEIMPWMSGQNLYSAVYIPQDGHLDPHGATHAVAKAARDLGAEIYTHTRVTGINLSPVDGITGVRTDKGDIRCDIVVNAAGLWGAQVAAMVGAVIPSTPVMHQHSGMGAVAGSEVPEGAPCFRDTDYLIYGRPEHGGLLVGGWETNPVSCWEDGVPWGHSATELPEDLERFEPLLENAIKRFPFLAEAGLERIIAHPDAFTPDANPLVGPWPGIKGFWLACGLSMNGFGGAGGIGKALAASLTAIPTWTFTDTILGVSARIIMTLTTRLLVPVNATATTTIPAIPMMRILKCVPAASVLYTTDSRIWVRCSAKRMDGNGSTIFRPETPGAEPEKNSGNTEDGSSHPISIRLPLNTPLSVNVRPWLICLLSARSN